MHKSWCAHVLLVAYGLCVVPVQQSWTKWVYVPCEYNEYRSHNRSETKHRQTVRILYGIFYFFNPQFSSWRVNASPYILHLNEAQPGCLQVIRRVATSSRRGLTICRRICDVSVINKISHYNICILTCIKFSDRSNFKGVLAALLPSIFKTMQPFQHHISRHRDLTESYDYIFRNHGAGPTWP